MCLQKTETDSSTALITAPVSDCPFGVGDRVEHHVLGLGRVDEIVGSLPMVTFGKITTLVTTSLRVVVAAKPQKPLPVWQVGDRVRAAGEGIATVIVAGDCPKIRFDRTGLESYWTRPLEKTLILAPHVARITKIKADARQKQNKRARAEANKELAGKRPSGESGNKGGNKKKK